jgi:ABC-type bacteriocin/lantibiotic exporter with double-glycine peptidase domain
MSQILVELVKMANLIVSMTKAAACADRIADVLDMEPEQKNGTKDASCVRGHVEFDDVTARYSSSGSPALSLPNII